MYRKKFIFFIGCFIILQVVSACAQDGVPSTFITNHNSTYKIYVPSQNDSLNLPVQDLQNYIYKVSEAELPIIYEKSNTNNLLIVGPNLLTKSERDHLNPGGFLIKTVNKNIIITGLDYKGVSNGIYTFLEKYMGCRYYAEDAIKIPKKDSIVFASIHDLQNPAFETAILHSYEAFSPEYARWHKLEMTPRKNTRWLKPWVHTTTTYISPQKYFKAHPEYFMLSEGRRRKEELDFSNKEVLHLMEVKIQAGLNKNQSTEYIGVSQADGNPLGICQGEFCQQLVKQRGAASTVLLSFVNQIANKFPNKTITTLAYHYTQKPPTSIAFKPEDNVMIILCNTEKNRFKATKLISQNPFVKDLQGWQKLTDNIMVWDYFGNMAYPIAPYPNLLMLQRNFKTYQDMGVSKIFAQSNGQKGAEFQELRSYLLAKLLWNPDVNIDSVMTDFLTGYYGAAAPNMKKYIELSTNQSQQSKQPLRRNLGPASYENSYLSPDLLRKYEELFVQAKNTVKNNKLLLKRIDKEQQAVRFAQLEIYSRKLKNARRYLIKTNTNPINKKEYETLLNEFVSGLKKYQLRKVSNKANSPEKYKNYREP